MWLGYYERGRLRAWLESGVEDDGTGMLFVAVRRSHNRISGDVGLLARVACARTRVCSKIISIHLLL
jgi:hypothetical protein